MTFEVLTDCWVIFRRADSAAWEAQLFRDVVVRGGGHKVFRYYEGKPRRSAVASLTTPGR